MKKTISILALSAFALAFSASAQQEQPEAPKGLIVRVDQDGNREIYKTSETKKKLTQEQVDAITTEDNRLDISTELPGSELDDDSSSESWCWYWGWNSYNYSYYYNYNGWLYSYYPAYYWNYGNYSYYYYRWW